MIIKVCVIELLPRRQLTRNPFVRYWVDGVACTAARAAGWRILLTVPVTAMYNNDWRVSSEQGLTSPSTHYYA